MTTTLRKLCQLLDVEYSGNGDLPLHRVAGLENPQPGNVVFVKQEADLDELTQADSFAVVVPLDTRNDACNLIFAADPLQVHTQITRLLHSGPKINGGVHATAIIAEHVSLGENVTLDPNVVLYENVTIGAGTVLRAGTVVMSDSTIGEGCLIYPNVVIRENCHIGNGVIIHACSEIGSDGYGYFQRDGEHHKIPQIGGVVIEDEVEIGGCCAIDRARFDYTVIGRGSKLDNLVHVAHNVEVGPHSLLTAQTGIAGSVKTGRNLVMGGQSGITDHVILGERVFVTGRAGVTKDFGDDETVAGFPARAYKKWQQIQVQTGRLESLVKRIKSLEAWRKKTE